MPELVIFHIQTERRDTRQKGFAATMETSDSMEFSLHPQLQADCHLLGQLDDLVVLLHRNSTIPWVILVPQTTVQDLLDLPEDQLQRAMLAARAAGRFVRQHFGLSKLNFGAIGNLVPQLHLHVVGRHPDDPCWPKPVWGNLSNSREYPEEELEIIRRTLQDEFNLQPYSN